MVEYKGKELIIMACSKCNIHCEHCYISYSGNRNPEELLEIVRLLKNKYEININGAEVLTDPRYLESYLEIGQPFVLSNGKVFLQDRTIINKLKDNNIKSVSISYHFGIQDELSPVKIIDLNKIIDIIKANGLEFRILTTIDSDNYMLIPYMCEKAYLLGARGIKFTNFLRQGSAQNMDKSKILNKEQIDDVFKLIMEEREKYDIDDFLIERCGTFGRNTLSNHDHFYCDAITDSVVLTPDNSIYPCVFLAKRGYEIGEFKDNKIMLFDNYENNHDRCLASEVCNNEKKLILKKG